MLGMRAFVGEVLVTLCLLAISVGAQAQGSPFAPKQIKQPDSLLIVHAGRLLAVPGQPVLEEQTVVIRNGRVSEILTGFADPDSFEKTEKTHFTVVDLREFLYHGLPFHTVPWARVSPHPNIPEYIRQVLVLLVVLLALFKI